MSYGDRMDVLRVTTLSVRKLALTLLPLSVVAGCCCGFSPEDITLEDGVITDGEIASGSGATAAMEKFGFSVEVPENAQVDTLSGAYSSSLIISETTTADGVTFTVYPPGKLITPESVEAHLQGYKEQELKTWAKSTFTDVELEIFGQTAKGIERNSNEGLPTSREFILAYPEGRFVAVNIEIWPPRNQEFVDGILASAKYDPAAPWSDKVEAADESTSDGE